MVLTSLLGVLLSVSFADAAIKNAMLRGRPQMPKIDVPEHPVMGLVEAALPSLHTVYYFDQFIDHTNPHLGTFQQRYWMNWEFYQKGIVISRTLDMSN